jgi:membrane-bound serine protease (ClpP class)
MTGTARSFAALALVVLMAGGVVALAADVPTVRVHRVDGMVHGVTAAIFERALGEAIENDAALFILELDTPGGVVTATEDMIEAMLNSPVPVAVWVGPRGAHAASAGFFLLMASDVAAMAPITRTGAAHPVMAGQQNDPDDIGLKKAAEDLAALMRSAAAARGRPAEVAETAIHDAKSWSAEEAIDLGLIELLANDREELLAALDGMEIRRSDGQTEVLDLDGAVVVEHELVWTEEFKNVVLHPAVMSLLLAVAAIGLMTEFYNPGTILPGLVGVAALLVFLYGSQVLPVNYFGAALVGLGLIMFLLEVKVVSYGLLSVGGAICTALGLYLFFDTGVPGLAIPLATIAVVTGGLVLFALGMAVFVLRSQRQPPTTGREGAVGERGVATTALTPEGTVFVHGEYWSARSTAAVEPGGVIRVVAVEPGLKLLVEPVDTARREGSAPAGQGAP